MRLKILAASLLCASIAGLAQEPKGHEQHPHPAGQKQRKHPPDHEQHPQPTGHEQHPAGEHTHPAEDNEAAGGPFKAMNAIGSGTSLLPASSPGYMFMSTHGPWHLMVHGELKVGFNHQGGPRGVSKLESQNMLMLMAQRSAGPGRLLLRGMFSAEPWTAPKPAFPQLLQTGETYRGRPIVDGQHAHDLFMELAASYTVPLSERASIFFYGGPVAGPALGPVAFMHRVSAIENPAAPLGHHLQDSTHIVHGVITAGVTAGRFRLEASSFHGAEPDENRHDIEMGRLDSWSTRAWWTPTRDWTLQVSHGHLENPEAAQPGNIERTTASVGHNRAWQGGNWATTLVWGRNHEEHGDLNSYLAESTLNFRDANYVFTRLELVDKIGLLQENVFGRRGGAPEDKDRTFRVGAFTFGVVRDLVRSSRLRLGVGAAVTFYHLPQSLNPVYGSPRSGSVFVRLRPAKMAHSHHP